MEFIEIEHNKKNCICKDCRFFPTFEDLEGIISLKDKYIGMCKAKRFSFEDSIKCPDFKNYFSKKVIIKDGMGYVYNFIITHRCQEKETCCYREIV